MQWILSAVVLVVSAASAVAQEQPPRVAQVVRLGTAASQGVDQTALDSIYAPATGTACTSCRFDSAATPSFRAAWDRFLNDVMDQCVREKVTFDQLLVRCYVGGDGWLDFVLYHAGDDPEMDRRFVAALRAAARAIRFPTATGPYRQSATIQLGG